MGENRFGVKVGDVIVTPSRRRRRRRQRRHSGRPGRSDAGRGPTLGANRRSALLPIGQSCNGLCN